MLQPYIHRSTSVSVKQSCSIAELLMKRMQLNTLNKESTQVSQNGLAYLGLYVPF